MVAASATGSAFAVDAGGNSSFEVTANTREGGASTPILAPLQIVPAPKPALVSGSASPGRVRVGKRVTVTFALRNPNTTTTLTGLGFSLRPPRGLAFAARSSATDTCHGHATERRGVLSVASGRLPAGGTCHVSSTLVPSRRGTYRLSSGTVSSSAGKAREASVTIRVLAA